PGGVGAAGARGRRRPPRREGAGARGGRGLGRTAGRPGPGAVGTARAGLSGTRRLGAAAGAPARGGVRGRGGRGRDPDRLRRPRRAARERPGDRAAGGDGRTAGHVPAGGAGGLAGAGPGRRPRLRPQPVRRRRGGRGGRGRGPVIAPLAGVDALPGMSPQAGPVASPVPGQDAGHACGHNLFGAAAVGAARAIAGWLREGGHPGEVRVYGTPAEEGGSGKVFMLRAGLFADVDVVLHWHPADAHSAAQPTSLANISRKFRFHGVAAHAAISPERGRSALDGVEALDHMANLLREHVPEGPRIHYAVTDGGRAPNVVPARAEAYYYVRHHDAEVVRDVFARLHDAARGAALGTGTTVEFEPLGGVHGLLP